MTTARARNRSRAIAMLWARARVWPWDGKEETLAVRVNHHAALFGPLTEPDAPPVFALLTQDYGAHSSGWWRNSQYERCFHLSLSHRGQRPGDEPIVLTRKELDAWAAEFFTPPEQRWLWLEPGYEKKGVTHLRLFIDEEGRPLLPTGEVYRLVPFADGSSPERVYRGA